ncbi:MAG: hypothetical protein HOI47_05250 [Candidatus Scalindua sp.]|jgi:hypothetical protein|nr:hypothetical protein [Candidatus Scalindua sp.]
MNANSKINNEDLEHMQFQRIIKPKKKRCGVAKIVDFFVSTDSVVAKATFVADTPALTVQVNWGDDKMDKVDYRAASHLHQPSEGDSLPPGTYEFYHRYDVSYWPGETSDNVVPKEYIVVLRVKDKNGEITVKPERIKIVPRYRFQYHRLYIGLKERCDFITEDRNNFNITQTIKGDLIHEWDWKPSNQNFPDHPNQPLEESQFVHEFEVSEDPFNNSSLGVSFYFEEVDRIFNDEVTISFRHPFRVSGESDGDIRSGRKEGTASGDGCKIMYRVDHTTKLLVPLPNNPNVIFASSSS